MEISVNSYHHQGVKKFSQRFVPMAFSPNGLVEGFYYLDAYNPAEVYMAMPSGIRVFPNQCTSKSIYFLTCNFRFGFVKLRELVVSMESENGHVNLTNGASSDSKSSDGKEDDDSVVIHVDDFSKTGRITFACDDGCVQIYTISDKKNLSYKRSLPRVSGEATAPKSYSTISDYCFGISIVTVLMIAERTLSVTWSSDVERIFSGSSDKIISLFQKFVYILHFNDILYIPSPLCPRLYHALPMTNIDGDDEDPITLYLMARTRSTAIRDEDLKSKPRDPIVVCSVVAHPAMFVEEQKMLVRFIKLAPPRFSGELSEDAYELIYSKYKLNNLGLVETCGMEYTAFQLDLVARHWWRGHLGSKPPRSPPLTWT
ncbi:hypothetical protein FXO38_24670 [Capsicum annuum]|nr:hypothetical protein FXO38_24670 [Capsicum annuum]KAF3659615.1 hypothetical protein FXO37_13895 [Capsicum annuum]